MKHFILWMALFCSVASLAQPGLSSAMLQHSYRQQHPAKAGADSLSGIGLFVRQQWIGVDGAPRRAWLGYDHAGTQKFGWAVRLQHDEISVFRRTAVSGDLAYHLRTPMGQFSAGIRLSLELWSAGLGEVQTLQPNDPQFMSSIPTKGMQNEGFGIAWKHKGWEAGACLPRLEQLNIDRVPADQYSSVFNTDQMAWMGYAAHRRAIGVHLQAGLFAAVIDDGEGDIQYLFSGECTWRNRLGVGVQYRHDHSASAYLTIGPIPDLRVFIGWEYSLSDYGQRNSGEIGLTWNFRSTTKSSS